MAQTFLTQDELRALDSTRNRLLQLTTSIGRLRMSVEQGDPLPPWSSIQANTAIVSQQIQTVTMQLAKQAPLLDRTVAYAAVNFPGRTQSSSLEGLMRKKLEPTIDTWVEQARAVELEGKGTIAEQETNVKDEEELWKSAERTLEGKGTIAEQETNVKDEEELWKSAERTLEERIFKYIKEEAGDDYTIEERESGVEHVNTGLKRKPDDDDDDEEEEDESEDDDAGAEGGTVRSKARKVRAGPVAVTKDPNRPPKSLEAMSKWATSGWEYQPTMPKKR